MKVEFLSLNVNPEEGSSPLLRNTNMYLNITWFNTPNVSSYFIKALISNEFYFSYNTKINSKLLYESLNMN